MSKCFFLKGDNYYIVYWWRTNELVDEAKRKKKVVFNFQGRF